MYKRQRMNTVAKPKQFLELNGKPIIIYTIELFDNLLNIDGIVVVCIEDWIPYMYKLINKFGITKVVEVVPGGETGQDSIYNGLVCATRYYSDDSVAVSYTHLDVYKRQPIYSLSRFLSCLFLEVYAFLSHAF